MVRRLLSDRSMLVVSNLAFVFVAKFNGFRRRMQRRL